MPKYALKGVPDIIIVHRRSFIGLEVKRPGNRQSEDQETFQRRVESSGGFYYVVTCLEDVIKAIKEINAVLDKEQEKAFISMQ